LGAGPTCNYSVRALASDTFLLTFLVNKKASGFLSMSVIELALSVAFSFNYDRNNSSELYTTNFKPKS